MITYLKLTHWNSFVNLFYSYLIFMMTIFILQKHSGIGMAPTMSGLNNILLSDFGEKIIVGVIWLYTPTLKQVIETYVGARYLNQTQSLK
jgi:hypothetical protein